MKSKDLEPLRVVAISDTHGQHQQVAVPDGDVLIHCGDYCSHGSFSEVSDLAKWMGSLPHKHKIATAGNHDAPVEQREHDCRQLFKKHGIHLLLNEAVVIDGVKFWGSPVTPMFFDWSFMKERGEEIAKVWAQIPEDADVIITHGPAYGHGDLCPPYRSSALKVAGCLDLLNRIRDIKNNTQFRFPRVHVCGHIHAGHGVTQSDEFGSLTFINAAICTEGYKPTNSPIGFQIQGYFDGQGQDTTGQS